MFAREKLQVYGKALDFTAKATAWTSSWDKKHALVDHLSRTSLKAMAGMRSWITLAFCR